MKPYRLFFENDGTTIYSDLYSQVLLYFLICREKKIKARIEQYAGSRNHVPDYVPIANHYTDVK